MGMSSDETIRAEFQQATTKIVNDNPDSIEIGTAGKGGAVKIYGNYSKPEEFKAKIDAAAAVKQYAKDKLAEIA